MAGAGDPFELGRRGASLAAQRQALGESLVAHGLPADRVPEVLSRARDGIVLEPTTLPRRSRLGGTGLLPAGEPWPTRPDGRPLSFVAALDLEELPALAPLPPDGTLLVYWDFDHYDVEPVDFVAGTRVFYLDAGDEAVEEQLGPPDWRFGPVPVDGFAALILGELADVEVSDAVFDAVLDPLEALHFHQLLGSSRDIQDLAVDEVSYWFGHARPETTARYSEAELRGEGWMLLAQIHEEEGIEIGDAGAIYLMIPEADLHARRFDRVMGIMQDH